MLQHGRFLCAHLNILTVSLLLLLVKTFAFFAAASRKNMKIPLACIEGRKKLKINIFMHK